MIERVRHIEGAYWNEDDELVLTIKYYVKYEGERERLVHTQVDV